MLRKSGFSVTVGNYSIRLNDCDHFVFEEYGGDLGDPVIDADADTLEVLLRDAERVSEMLTSNQIRHRFELYDAGGKQVGYLHHQWPQEPNKQGN